jgi:hypothetical protein
MILNGKGEFDQDELSWWAIILEWSMSNFFKYNGWQCVRV